MCGIIGISSQHDVDRYAVGRMCDAIVHRGPDDSGVKVWKDHGVGLGHRRLSIIDLSPAGHNPMSNEDGTVWIVYNGEIYNFQEMRRDLEQSGHVFRSNSDTEVVLHAYEEWGDDHVQHLRGMFAYALYDRRPRGVQGGADANCSFRLLLVRDRVGIKPLFYYWDGCTFLFASEIKAIRTYPGLDFEVDQSALFDYLTYLYVPAPKTAYTHIRKLQPGYQLVFSGGHIQTRQYWDVPLDAPNPARNPDEAAEMVRHLLTEAVRLHMISDVPVGVFLSGGVDSSTVTALMAQISAEPVRTFSIGFDVAAHSETGYARLVAERYRTQHYERIVGVDSVRQMLPRMVEMYDEPYADGSAVPTLRVSATAREQVKVVLSGDGGDEVFAGYNWYTAWLRRRALDTVPLSARQPVFGALSRVWPPSWRGQGWLSDIASGPLERYARLMEMFSPERKRQIVAPDLARQFADYDDYWYFRQFWREEMDPLTRLQYLDLKTYLPDDILTKVDRASMAVALEVRPPLLDHVLIENVFALPSQWRAPNGAKKHLFKQAVRDLLPEPIVSRSKKGFSAPWTVWLRSEQEWAERTLQSGSDGWLRAEVAQIPWLFDKGPCVLGLLVLHQWLQNESAGM